MEEGYENHTRLSRDQCSNSARHQVSTKYDTKYGLSRGDDPPHFDQSALPDDRPMTPDEKAKEDIKRAKAKTRWAEH